MEIRHLKIFMAVCDEMSFSKASKKLSYAQSTISNNILTLEKSLGCKLFERFGKKIYLTEKGKRLRELGEKLIYEYDYVMKSMTEMPKETICIGITETLCFYKFPDFFRQFLLNHSNIKIDFEIARDKEIIEMLRRNKIDLGYIFDSPKDYDDIKTYDLFDEEIVFVNSEPINDLNHQNIIIPKGNVAYMRFFHNFYEQNNIKKGTIIHLESIEGIKSYVKSGFGISFLPLTTVQEDISKKTLFLVKQKESFVDKVKMGIHRHKQITSGLNDLIEETLKNYSHK